MGGSSEPAVFSSSIAQNAAASPDSLALATAEEDVTYGELDARIGRVADMLAQHGIQRGDRVAICAANRIEVIELVFACARLRAILVPINNRLTGPEIRFQLGDCTPSLVIVQEPFFEAVAAAGWDFEPLRIVSDAYHCAGGDVSTSGSRRDPDLDDDVLLVYTSGTTGTPKGAVLTQRSLYYTVLNGLEHEGFSADSSTIAVLPMFHVGGLNIQLLPCLIAGGSVYLEERFDAERLLCLLRERRPSHLILVPAIMQAIEAGSSDLGADLASLGALNCGSSVVSIELIQRYVDAGVRIVQVYGATETGPTSIVLDYEDASRFGSCGKPAVHTEMRIVRPDGERADVSEIGELVLRGPNLFDRYWKNESATAAAIRDGWYHTGDLGFIDKDGFTFVTGRSKEMIISGGENIYPAEVEQIIECHDSVAAVAVVGRSDSRWGEVPVAFVVPAAGSAATVEDLQVWTRAQLAGYKQPREWVVVDALPRTSLGKVQKHRLIAQESTSSGGTK